ncbi:hypothetical protein BH20ACT2_BH20ACT2_17210 [soil metagenome]
MGAAGVLLAGAGACALTTQIGWPLYQTLALLGAVAVGAWLVDGSSERFMGPGLTALAVGGGISLYRSLETGGVAGEHTIVYPLVGVALLASSYFHPLAARGAGTFLLIVGAIAQFSTPWNPGWSLVAILVSWGVLEFIQAGRSTRDADSSSAGHGRVDRSEPQVTGSDGRATVGASR